MSLKRAVRYSDIKPFKFLNKGDTLKGYYKKTTDEVINGSPVKKHIFETKTGLVSVLGQWDLYRQLTDNNCLNTYVEATLEGVQQRKGGKTLKIYTLDFDVQDTSNEDIVVNTFGNEAAGGTAYQEGTDGYTEDDGEETGLYEDEALDEVAPARAAAPRGGNGAKSPTAAQRAKVEAVLAGRNRQ